jgi:hypothetical protein
MDYRELLMKYIEHIGEEEGITFIHGQPREGLFTPEEWAELKRLDIESKKYRLYPSKL